MKNISLLYILFFISCGLYAQPIYINDGWTFYKGEQTGKGIKINLPHTWNALDGQDGGGDYYRGTGWYTRILTLDKQDKDKTIYLRFGAVNKVMELYVNGQKAGEHQGGYTAFAINITPFIHWEAPNEIKVMVSNSDELEVCPISADFTFFGGIIRGVELIRKERLHITCNDFGSKGIYIKQESSREKAELTLTAKIRNDDDKKRKIGITFKVKDEYGKVVEAKTVNQIIAPHTTTDVIEVLSLLNPHLWNGKEDPYLYRVEAVLCEGKQEIDCVVQPLGIRFFSIDPNQGFFLNGVSYPLRGCSLHEERKDKGNAVTDADRKEDIDQLLDMGCNYIRLAHYQHGDFTYNYLDTLGIICWTEIPLINRINDSEEFAQNCKNMMKSMIRQLYNHPSIVVWGVSNEINYRKGPNPLPLIKELNDLVHQEDRTRLSTLAAMFSEKPTNFITDVYSNNRYDGWYYNEVEDIASFCDNLHQKYPDRSIGISEYGVGAHPFQHEEVFRKPKEDGQWHPEGFQSYFHEFYLKTIKERPYLWSTSIWAAYDFASDGRDEGCQPGINDKGLITHDRKIKKDAYYFYKANWNKEPMLYICARRYMKRTVPETTIKLYSNFEDITLILNGNQVQMNKKDHCVFLSDTVYLKEGENEVVAKGHINGKEYSDRVIWNYIP